MASSFGALPLLPSSEPSHWPGISVSVYQIARLPGDRVSVRFIYRAARTAPAETYIADRPIKQFTPIPENPELEIAHPGRDQEYYPYTLGKTSELIDEATGKVYPAAEFKAGDAVHPGQMEVMEVVKPGGGFYLGGIFECPPVNQDDPPQIQRVSFQLPGMKKPIKGVLLPREVNVAVDFYPKPKVLPLGTPRPKPTPTATPNG